MLFIFDRSFDFVYFFDFTYNLLNMPVCSANYPLQVHLGQRFPLWNDKKSTVLATEQDNIIGIDIYPGPI